MIDPTRPSCPDSQGASHTRTCARMARPNQMSVGSITASGSAQPPERWRALALLATAALMEMTPWFSASAVLPQLRSVWGVSPSAGAWLTISVQLGFVAGALLSAALSLADILPPRRLMLI